MTKQYAIPARRELATIGPSPEGKHACGCCDYSSSTLLTPAIMFHASLLMIILLLLAKIPCVRHRCQGSRKITRDVAMFTDESQHVRLQSLKSVMNFKALKDHKVIVYNESCSL